MTVHDPTSTTDDPGEGSSGSVKTLAVRLKPDTHAQLRLIAQLRGATITDEIRQAIDAHIQSVGAAPEFAAQAENVLAEIDRQATARRDAIAHLLGSQPSPSGRARTVKS